MNHFCFPRVDDWFARLTIKAWYRFPRLDMAMVTIARWTPLAMLLLIALAATHHFLLPYTFKTANIGSGCAVFGAVLVRILNEPISRSVKRPRPFEVEGFIPLLSHEGGDSFPSNHATGALALAIGCLHIPGYNVILLILAGLLCISRIYCGLHYVTDVWFGAFHGLIAGVCVLWVAATVL